MKRTILIALMALGMSASAQIEVKETTNSSREIWSSSINAQTVTELIVENDTIFALTYRNARYQYLTQFESISFKNKAELIAFLQLCDTAITQKREFSVSVGFDESLRIKRSGSKAVIFTSPGWLYLDRKSIIKIIEAL